MCLCVCVCVCGCVFVKGRQLLHGVLVANEVVVVEVGGDRMGVMYVELFK